MHSDLLGEDVISETMSEKEEILIGPVWQQEKDDEDKDVGSLSEEESVSLAC